MHLSPPFWTFATDSLQYVQNSAVRLLWSLLHSNSCTDTEFCITYKLLLPYKSLHDLNPTVLLHRQTLKMALGHRTFSVAATTLWNSLSVEVRHELTLDSFKISPEETLVHTGFRPLTCLCVYFFTCKVSLGSIERRYIHY